MRNCDGRCYQKYNFALYKELVEDQTGVKYKVFYPIKYTKEVVNDVNIFRVKYDIGTHEYVHIQIS